MTDTVPKSYEIWESEKPVAFTVQESASEVDGIHILAKVAGPAFFPDTVSRNKVHYPAEAWENAINDDDFNRRLADRLVFGTIGHEIDLDDAAIREGKMSHIVTKVWIDEDDNIGKAEYLILNTEPGRVLNTLLRAGSKLRVSTKAEGFFESSRNRDGSKSIIPDKFTLERIDFVRDPGYRNANPVVIESINSDTPTKEDTMSDVTTILEARIAELKEELASQKHINEGLVARVSELSAAQATAQAVVESYSNYGTLATVQESLTELAQYQSVGSVQEIREALEQGEETIDSLTTSLDDTTKELEALSADVQNADYDDLGEPSQVRDALDAAQEVISELAKYRALGSVEEIAQVIDRAGEMTEALEEQELQSLADRNGVDVETVKALCAKCDTLEEAESIIAAIKGNAAAEPVVAEEVPPPADDVPPAGEEQEDDTEECEGDMPVMESMSSRLLNRSHKFTSRLKIAESNNGKASEKKPLSARLMTTKR